MKKILLIIAIAISTNIYAQKGSSQFSLFGGFEHFPELKCRNGYNVGVEFKHYLNNRVYALANFHAGVNDGTKNVSYTRDEIDYNFDLSNSVRDYIGQFFFSEIMDFRTAFNWLNVDTCSRHMKLLMCGGVKGCNPCTQPFRVIVCYNLSLRFGQR